MSENENSSMKTKIQLKSLAGSLLFEFETEENSTRKTVEEAVRVDANLQDANLRGADLQGANLGGANLQGANLGMILSVLDMQKKHKS